MRSTAEQLVMFQQKRRPREDASKTAIFISCLRLLLSPVHFESGLLGSRLSHCIRSATGSPLDHLLELANFQEARAMKIGYTGARPLSADITALIKNSTMNT